MPHDQGARRRGRALTPRALSAALLILLTVASLLFVGRRYWVSAEAPGPPDSEAPGTPLPASAEASRVLAAHPTAKLAFAGAYEEAMRAPADALSPDALLRAAKYLSVFDKAKARALLGLADDLLAAGQYPWGAVRALPEGVPRPHGNYTHESEFAIKMGATAALVDVELARKQFVRAREANGHKSPADELLAVTAEAAILVLDGDADEAIARGVAFCQETPQVTFFSGGCGLGKESKSFVAEVLLSVSPETAVELASRFDVDFHAETLAKLAQLVVFWTPTSDLEYHRQAAALARDVENDNLRHGILRRVAQAVAGEDIDEALRFIRTMDFSGARGQALGECLRILAETDLNRAIRLAVEWPNADDSRNVLDDIARVAIRRDPKLVTHVLSAMDNAYRAGTVLGEAAAESARRGDAESAMRLVDMIERDDRRARALAQVATEMADNDRARALALLEQAFGLALAHDTHGRLLEEVSRRTALVDERKGVECYDRALEYLLPKCQTEGYWRRYYRVAESLAALDAARALAALRRVPQLRFGDEANDLDAASADVLQYLVAADWKFVEETLRDLIADGPPTYSDSRKARLVRDIVVGTGVGTDEEGDRLVRLLPDDYRQRLERELLGLRLVRQIVANPEGAEKLLAEARAEHGPYVYEDAALSRAANEMAERDLRAAVEFAAGLANDSVRDMCLASLCERSHESPEHFRQTVGLIRDRNTRIYCWLGMGEAQAKGIAGWDVLREWPRL